MADKEGVGHTNGYATILGLLSVVVRMIGIYPIGKPDDRIPQTMNEEARRRTVQKRIDALSKFQTGCYKLKMIQRARYEAMCLLQIQHLDRGSPSKTEIANSIFKAHDVINRRSSFWVPQMVMVNELRYGMMVGLTTIPGGIQQVGQVEPRGGGTAI